MRTLQITFPELYFKKKETTFLFEILYTCLEKEMTTRPKREATKVLIREPVEIKEEITTLLKTWLNKSEQITKEDMKNALTLTGDEMQQWLLHVFQENIADLLYDQQLLACPFYWDGKKLEFCLNSDDKELVEWHKIILKLIKATELDDWEKGFDIQFMVFPIILQAGKNSVNHANVLIVDMHNQIIERFDPIGYEGVATWNSDGLDSQIAAFFHAVPLLSKFVFQPLSVSCPNLGVLRNGKYIFKGPQAKERTVKYWKGEPKGFCSSWSMMYIFFKLHFPGITQENMAKSTAVFKPTELRSIIRYFCWLISMQIVPEIKRVSTDSTDEPHLGLCLHGNCLNTKKK